MLGETILRAYLIRRADLIDAGAGMRIVGSCYSADTRRLLEFCTRNRLPHRWIDVEKLPEVDAFLQRMNVAPEDTPVVVLANGRVLKNPSTAALADELHLRVPVPGSENGPHSILETSVPGLFAAGDVRSGAARRVAAAMGEGAIAVALAGQYLTSTGRTVTS